MFGSRKEAEEKYSALEKEHGELEALFETLQNEKAELESKLEALTTQVDTLTAQGDSKVGDFKAALEERLTLAVEAGIATKAIFEVVNAESTKDAAMATVKAVRSTGSTVSAATDVGDDVSGFDDDDPVIAAALKTAKGE